MPPAWCTYWWALWPVPRCSHFQRCSIRFQSGLWLGRSRTFRVVLKPLLPSHCCCPAGRWTIAPVWDQARSGAGFHPVSLCIILHSSFPLYWLKVSQFLPLKNIPQHDAAATMLHWRDGIDLVTRPDWWMVLLEGSPLSRGTLELWQSDHLVLGQLPRWLSLDGSV